MSHDGVNTFINIYDLYEAKQMGRNSVFPDDHEPTLADLKAMGRQRLNRLWFEAAKRRDRQRQVYGPSYRPGRQGFMDWSIKQDMEIIENALRELDRDEGKKTNECSTGES